MSQREQQQILSSNLLGLQDGLCAPLRGFPQRHVLRGELLDLGLSGSQHPAAAAKQTRGAAAAALCRPLLGTAGLGLLVALQLRRMQQIMAQRGSWRIVPAGVCLHTQQASLFLAVCFLVAI